MTLYGPDISSYQPNTDFKTLRTRSPFAFCKATEGLSYVDSQLKHNRQGAYDNGFLFLGLYHFSRLNQNSVDQEVAHYLSTVGGFLDHEIPVLDWEGMGGGIGWKAAEWLDKVEQATGKLPIIYGNYYDLQQSNPTALTRWPLWIAGYVSHPQISPWTEYTFWQYTDKAQVPGVGGNCDDNKFEGTEQDLMNLVDRLGGNMGLTEQDKIDIQNIVNKGVETAGKDLLDKQGVTAILAELRTEVAAIKAKVGA